LSNLIILLLRIIVNLFSSFIFIAIIMVSLLSIIGI